jgi:glycosyltransferase involved in cell wall biosynthesis
VSYWSDRGIPQSRIRVIPWGIEPDCVEARDGAATRRRLSLSQPVILSVGSLIDAKGPQHLIQALPSVVSIYPSATLVFCGPTTRYIEELKKLASSLNISDRVRFLGFVERAELLNLYAACDVFALPSAFEGFGIATAEALASGKPVIAGDAGATYDLLGGGSAGIIVSFGDVPAIANGVLRLLAEPQLATTLGTRGRQLAAGYRWEEVGRQYETLYGEVLAGT